MLSNFIFTNGQCGLLRMNKYESCICKYIYKSLKIQKENHMYKEFLYSFYGEFIYRDFINRYFIFSIFGNIFINILQLSVFVLDTSIP